MTDASTAEGVPEAPPASDQVPDPAATTTPPEPETFDRDYVEKLRKESAGYRSRLKESDERLAEVAAARKAAEDAEKTESERLAGTVEEERLARATAETELNRLRAANQYKIEPELVPLINGATAEEAMAHAELLAKHAGGNAGGTFPPMPHGTQPPPPKKALAEQVAEAEKSGDWQLAGQLKSQQLVDLQKRT